MHVSNKKKPTSFSNILHKNVIMILQLFKKNTISDCVNTTGSVYTNQFKGRSSSCFLGLDIFLYFDPFESNSA